MNVASRTKWRPRVSLAQLLLLVTTFAIAMAYYRTHRRLVETETIVGSLRGITRDLRVDDPTKIVAIAKLPTLPTELIFDVYVPPDSPSRSTLELCLGLEGIRDTVMRSGNREPLFPVPVDRYPIGPGRHSIEIRHVSAVTSDSTSVHRVEILLDDEVVMEAKRPPSWRPTNGWSSTGSLSYNKEFDPQKPAELLSRRFLMSSTNGGFKSVPSDEPANGIFLWIEPATDAE